MPLKFRRVVTGHDTNGRAIVQIDEIAKNLVSARPGATAGVVWTTEGFPVDNNGSEDAGLRRTGTTLASGTVFRVLELMPGSARSTIAPTRSTTRSSFRARSTWCSTIQPFI